MSSTPTPSIDFEKFKGHTPEPWKLIKEHANLYSICEGNSRLTFAEHGYNIAEVFGGMPLNEFEANAALIAAAPSLLKEVERLRKENERLNALIKQERKEHEEDRKPGMWDMGLTPTDND